jgi:hypothetical protein
MRVYWMLISGEHAEIYDGADAAAKDKVVVYRIGVERLHKAEVKIVRPNAKPKIINVDSLVGTLDVATSGSLFLEVIGKDGAAFGWYEALPTA